MPVLNKIDMDSAMIDEVKDQVVDLLGCKPEEILCASGKTGQGVEEILEAIVQRLSLIHIFTAGNVEVSCDGRTFVPAGTLEDGCLTLRPERPLRAVRIVSTCEGNGCSFVVLPAPIVKPLL